MEEWAEMKSLLTEQLAPSEPVVSRPRLIAGSAERFSTQPLPDQAVGIIAPADPGRRRVRIVQKGSREWQVFRNGIFL